MHQGALAEMKTGEGKTMTVLLPAFLGALSGRGVPGPLRSMGWAELVMTEISGPGTCPAPSGETGRVTDLRAVVDRMLLRCEASWSPGTERWVSAAGGDPGTWLPTVTGLLRASWNEEGRAAAVAAAALVEFALDTGPRDHRDRPGWVLHLWLAERTLSFRFGDHRLSRDVHHHLGAQTQGRSPDDLVAVAARYVELPLPRHFQQVQPIEQAAAQLAAALPPGDPGRSSVLVRLAQSACCRYESGDGSALAEAWRWGRAAYSAVTPDHLEADLVGRTAVHTALAWLRANSNDRAAAEFAVTAARAALHAVEHARIHGTDDSPHERASVHLLAATAFMAMLPFTFDPATVDEALAHLEAFRADGPPDDHGLYAANTASLLAARAVLSGSRKDLARSDALWGVLQNDLPAGDPLLPHVVQKRAACAEMARLMRLFPFGAGLLRTLRPLIGPMVTLPSLPPIRLNAPMRRPGYHSPGAGPDEVASFLRDGTRPSAPVDADPRPARPRPAEPGPVPATAYAASLPPTSVGPPDPPADADLAGLPPIADAVFRGLTGADPTAPDPRRLVLAERELRARLAEPGLDDGRRGWTATVLVFVLAARCASDEDLRHLAAAVEVGDDVLAQLPPTSSRYLDLLCAVEQHRHGYGFLLKDDAAVSRSCEALGWAMRRIPQDSPRWLGCAVPYAAALSEAAILHRDPDRSAQARRILEDVARRLEILPEGITPWGTVAEYRERFRPALARITDLVELADAELRGDRYGVEQADVRWDPEAERVLPSAARFENARTAMGREMERQAWGRAADAAQTALEVLPLLTSRALHRDDRQAVLSSAMLGRRYAGSSAIRDGRHVPDQLAGTSLGRTGCAVAIAAGRTDQAAALLEQGRAVLMSQNLEARSDVSDLAASHPELASRFVELGERMHRAEETTVADETAQVREQHAAAGAWDRLLHDIRSTTGLTRFLLPPTVAQMRTEASQGPIVLINVDRLRCDALVVGADGIRVVPLDVTEGLLAHTAEDFLEAVAVDLDSPREQQERARETVFSTLEWLWDKVAEPVMEAAGLTEPIPQDAPRSEVPRLWWSASGPLAHLPLHAAGYQRKAALDGGRSVLDRAATSYTPSIRVLHHSRRSAASGDSGRPYLAVAQDTGTGGSRGASAAEVAAVARTLTQLRVLDGHGASVLRVLQELRSAATVHFACHGVSDPGDPSRSHLALADGPLGVLDVARQQLPHARLAVLLACHTAHTNRLPDEAIHLASAFQTAGYPQVIGALWEAADLVSQRLAGQLYRSLRRYGGGLDVDDAGRALHGIVRGLRARYVRSPAVWAPYMHAGR